MSGLKWVKMVLSGARGKYGEITERKFHLNYFLSKKKEDSSENKSNQNQNKLNLNTNKIKYNKFGFPTYNKD